MKTLKQILKVAFLLVTLTVVFSCDKKQNKNTTPLAVVGTYTTNAYGQCVVTATGQPAPNQSYCQNTGYQQGYQQQIQCNGNYWFWNNYQWQMVQCYQTNCAGYTVYPMGATSQNQAIRCL